MLFIHSSLIVSCFQLIENFSEANRKKYLYFECLAYLKLDLSALVKGVLLDDLLVAEDLAASETTTAASHAAAAAATSNLQAGRLQGRYADERMRQAVSEVGTDGAVVLGSPVAPPLNGDMYTDISTENAVLQVPR